MASNTLLAALPTVFARSLQVLRSTCIMPRLVNTEFSNQPANQGDTINITVPSAVAVADVSPTAAPQDATSGQAPARVPITLNRWRRAAIQITDKEKTEIFAGVLPRQVEAGMVALAEDINSFIFGLYRQIYTAVGAAGTTPFASNLDAYRDARAALNRLRAPVDPRYIVLDPSAEANAIVRPEFLNINQGGTEVQLRGQIGTRLGATWFMDQQVPLHASTALTAGACTANGAQAAGAGATNGGRNGTVSINKATNASNLVAGDIITFAGHTQQYVVTQAVELAVGNTTVNISPALQVGLAGGEAVTLVASHRVNLMFHRDAFAFASRPLVSASEAAAAGNMMSMTDPISGVALRMEITRQNKRDLLEWDVLYGASVWRPELAVRVLG